MRLGLARKLLLVDAVGIRIELLQLTIDEFGWFGGLILVDGFGDVEGVLRFGQVELGFGNAIFDHADSEFIIDGNGSLAVVVIIGDLSGALQQALLGYVGGESQLLQLLVHLGVLLLDGFVLLTFQALRATPLEVLVVDLTIHGGFFDGLQALITEVVLQHQRLRGLTQVQRGLMLRLLDGGLVDGEGVIILLVVEVFLLEVGGQALRTPNDLLLGLELLTRAAQLQRNLVHSL